ncbi:ribonuclease H-like domain-containing protein [Tanacetum coccineum]
MQQALEEVEEKPVRIIPGPAGIVQLAKIHKQSDIHEGRDDTVLLTQEYMKQVIDDVGEDEDFNSGSWNGKLEQVVAIIKSCSSNALGDLKVTVKNLSGTLAGSIHYKVINEGVGGYGKEITIGSAIILANVLVFYPNPSMHYLNITKKNMVKVFHKDLVPGNGSGIGGSRMLMEEEEIVKLVEEEEMTNLELHVCGNVIDQEDLYKFDEEALDLILEEDAMESKAHEEWLEKCRQQEEEDVEHER